MNPSDQLVHRMYKIVGRPGLAIAAPLIIGLIADQFFPAQKILGVLHIAGAALLWFASTLTDFSALFPVILVDECDPEVQLGGPRGPHAACATQSRKPPAHQLACSASTKRLLHQRQGRDSGGFAGA